jgi:L-ascorbate metabolism protein UlaG (beta-lactamase superfamily)
MNPNIIVRKLSWAGVQVDAGDDRLVIDGLEGRDGAVQGRIGQPRRPLIPISDKLIDLAVVTHTHKDHYDLDALRRRLKPDGLVIAPAGSADEVKQAGLQVIGAKTGETIEAGRFRLTALPAVDGFGAVQVSWLVEVAGRKLLHFGDTLFHGYWWEIAQKAGRVDVAFFPINGARVAIPGAEATGLPGILTAEQAVVAARIIKPKLAVPIHYEEFHNPPVYTADLNAQATFIEHATRQSIPTRIVAAGEIAYAA